MDSRMMEMLAKLQAGFASGTSGKWQVKPEEYPEILRRILADWTGASDSGDAGGSEGFGAEEGPRAGEGISGAGSTKGKRLVRVAGQSGSGKTTQLVPAVEAWFEGCEAGRTVGDKGSDSGCDVGGSGSGADVEGFDSGFDAEGAGSGFDAGARPVLVAASRIAKYHPNWQEMSRECDEGQLRRETDGFAAAMMFLLLKELLARGYDVILDLALVEPKLEGILTEWLKEYGYDFWMTMMVVPPEVSRKWLGERSWRHSEETEQRFLAATEGALEFYAGACPEMRMVMWSAQGMKPIYDGAMSGAVEVWREHMKGGVSMNLGGESSDVEELAQRKVEYFRA